jgi:5-methylcytosine-specific restriction endonuclease McrA
MNAQLKLDVQTRAAQRCEHCGLRDALDQLPFQVDHVIAVKHGGRTDLANLAWSCFDCNIFKGPNLAGLDPASGTVETLFYPRQDDWHDNFRWRGRGSLD